MNTSAPHSTHRLFIRRARRLFGLLLSREHFRGGLFELFIALLPKLQRTDLIRWDSSRPLYVEVEGRYHFFLEKPQDPISAVRFAHLAGPRTVDPFFSVLLEDVRLIGPWGVPVTRKGQIIIEPLGIDYFKQIIEMTVAELGLLATLRQYLLALFPVLEKSREPLALAAHLIARGGHQAQFGHWVGEQLPQLRAISAMEKAIAQEVPLLINSDPSRWQLQTLKAMGFERNSTIVYSGRSQRVSRLVLSSLRNVHSRAMEIDPRARRWVVAKIRDVNAANHRETDGDGKLFVLRQSDKTRCVTNADEVRSVLHGDGFEEFFPASKAKADEIVQLRRVGTFLGVFGSGLMNALFMPGLGQLVEIFGPHQSDRFVFYYLAAELGIGYQSIAANAVENALGCRDALEVPTARLSQVCAQLQSSSRGVE